MTPRQYKLLLTRTQKFALAAPLVVFILMPFLFLFMFTFGPLAGQSHTENLPPFFPWFPFVFFLAFAAYFGWWILSLPHEITVTHDRMLVFRSVLRSRPVRPTDITLIEPKSIRMNLGISGYQLTYLNGKILY